MFTLSVHIKLEVSLLRFFGFLIIDFVQVFILHVRLKFGSFTLDTDLFGFIIEDS